MVAFASLRNLWKKFGKKSRPFSQALKSRLHVEALETRLVPYSVSGNAWPHPELVTISFTPDGTNLGGAYSNLQSTFDNHANPSFRANWRKEVLRAAQVWAQQTNLNFALVADNGAASGSGLYQQGDTGFGDVRIGGMNLGGSVLSSAYLPPPINNYSIAGDINFSTTQVFNLNSTYDLFTVATHEFGHALGLYHNDLLSTAVMYPYYVGIKSSLRTDDILGIRNIYSANFGRAQDSYEGLLGNGTFLTATDITGLLNPTDKTALVPDRDITTTTDLDYYKVTAPAGTTSMLTVNVQSTGLSLLSPLVRVYNSAQVEIGSASGLNQYGATLTVPISGVSAGQQFYVMVDGADNTAFGTGKYALTLNFGTGPSPSVPLPNTQTLNGNPISGGGGVPNRVDFEAPVNTTTANEQETSAESPQAVAMNDAGNYVVTWASKDQDGSGWGVYARRFNSVGVAQGDEFRVNYRTSGDQRFPAVAMDAAGNFVITWSSYSQGDDEGNWDVFARRYDAAGVARGGEFRVNTSSDTDQMYSTVAMSDDGKFVLTWSSYSEVSSSYSVLARRFNALGVAQGSEFYVNVNVANDQMYSRAAMDADGDFVITWSSKYQDGDDWGVYARKYTVAGVPVTSEFQVNTHTTDDQMYSAVAMDADGDFVITWSSKDQDGDGWGIYGQRYHAAAAAQGDEFRLNTTTLGDQQWPTVAMDAAGNFLATWSSKDQDGDGYGVYVRHYNRLGTATDVEFRANTTTVGDQKYSSIALDDYGRVVVVWSGNGMGDANGLFSQRYAIENGPGVGDAYSSEPHDHGHESCGEGCTCPECLAASAAVAAPAAQPAETTPTVDSAAPTTSSSTSTGANRLSQARDTLFANLDRFADLMRIR